MTLPRQVAKVAKEVVKYTHSLPAVIETREQFVEGSEYVIKVNREYKKRRKWFDQFLEPGKKAKAAAVAMIKEQEGLRDFILAPLVEAERTLRGQLLEFDRKEQERVRRLQEQEDKKYEQRVIRAEKKGKEARTISPPKEIVAGPRNAVFNTGSFSIKREKKVTIDEEGKIPEAYWTKVLDMKKLEKDLRDGVEVPGARLEEVTSSMIRSR